MCRHGGIVREDIIDKHEEYGPENTTCQVDAKELARIEMVSEHLPEPIQPKHIEQDMQYVVMQKHIGDNTPGLYKKARKRRGEFRVAQPRFDTFVEEHQQDISHAHQQEYADIHEQEARQKVAFPESMLHIRNKTHCLLLSSANIES